MKLFSVLISVLVPLAALNVEAASGIRVGALTASGKACVSTNIRAIVRNITIAIPGQAIVQLSRFDRLERGACQFALPIQVSNGYRLHVVGMTAQEMVQLSPQTRSRSQIEVFLPGQRQQPLISQNRARGQNLSHRRMISSGLNIVSGCGQSLILRGNAAVTLQKQDFGQWQGSSRVALSNLRLRYFIESCR